MTDEIPQKQKPTFEDLYAYAGNSIKHYIRKFAGHLPAEQKEEITQNALLRVWEAFLRLDADRGWRSFVQLHCRGAVLDYLKGGSGYIEDGHVTEGSFDGLKVRIEMDSKDGSHQIDTENVLGAYGVFISPQVESDLCRPKWDLLSRMAGADEDLHIICKMLMGYTQEEIAIQIRAGTGKKLSRERISQRAYEMFEKFDSPDLIDNPWVNQCIYALGLCSHYHMPEMDNGQGWERDPFDLASPLSFRIARAHYEPTFWDIQASVTPDSICSNRMVV